MPDGLDRRCPGCGTRAGYRHGFSCDVARCKDCDKPLRDCNHAWPQAPLWSPKTSNGLVAVTVAEDDALTELYCEQCHVQILPGEIVLLPRGEKYAIHASCLIRLAESLKGVTAELLAAEATASQPFEDRRTALIAYARSQGLYA